jgi:dipeptidyl aminopeptidase/acylaminoacyl peptidase
VGLEVPGDRKSGQNGNQYYMYVQGRWGFSPCDKPDGYHAESALTHVPETVAPFLIMHGTADPTVSFSEGIELLQRAALQRQGSIHARVYG